MNAPDTITIPEAVKALVDWAGDKTVLPANSILPCLMIRVKYDKEHKPDYVLAIENGDRSDAAYRVGLEDLFVSILMDAKEAES